MDFSHLSLIQTKKQEMDSQVRTLVSGIKKVCLQKSSSRNSQIEVTFFVLEVLVTALNLHGCKIQMNCFKYLTNIKLNEICEDLSKDADQIAPL